MIPPESLPVFRPPSLPLLSLLLPVSFGPGLLFAPTSRWAGVDLVYLSNEIVVRSEDVLAGKGPVSVPVEDALGSVVTVLSTALAGGELILGSGHSAVRGVILNPSELRLGNVEVATVAISQVVEGCGVSS